MGSILNIKNSDFSKQVEQLVITKQMTYIDAVLHLCEELNIEPSSVNKLLSKPIKEQIRLEGQEINLLPKDNKITII